MSEENSDGIDLEKTDKAYTELIEIFQKYKLNVKEILLAYGNLGYSLGASIGGYHQKGPSPEQLQHLYATNPTVDVALMIQGVQTTFWADDVGKTAEDIKRQTEEK